MYLLSLSLSRSLPPPLPLSLSLRLRAHSGWHLLNAPSKLCKQARSLGP